MVDGGAANPRVRAGRAFCSWAPGSSDLHSAHFTTLLEVSYKARLVQNVIWFVSLHLDIALVARTTVPDC